MRSNFRCVSRNIATHPKGMLDNLQLLRKVIQLYSETCLLTRAFDCLKYFYYNFVFESDNITPDLENTKGKHKMNQKFCQVYSTLLALFVIVIPSINCHQNPKISVCPGEGTIYQSNLFSLDQLVTKNQIRNTKCQLTFFIVRLSHLFSNCDIIKKNLLTFGFQSTIDAMKRTKLNYL